MTFLIIDGTQVNTWNFKNNKMKVVTKGDNLKSLHPNHIHERFKFSEWMSGKFFYFLKGTGVRVAR